MARINWKGWVAADGLSNDAAKGAITEIGVERLDLGKAGDEKALREIKSITDKWAKKHPCKPGCAPTTEGTPKSGAKPKAAAAKPAPKSEAKPAPKSESKPKAAAAKPAPKTSAKAAPTSEAKPAPKSESKPKAAAVKPAPKSEAKPAPKSEPKPKATAKGKAKAAPKSEAKAAPKSESRPKTAAKEKPAASSATPPKSESKPEPKNAEPKKPKAKAKGSNVTAEKIKELRVKLVDELGKLRVACPGERAKLVEDASAALATARAVAQVSPEVRRARNELQAALNSYAGYETAKAAIASAEKSVPVREAKAHVKAVIAEQVGERDLQIVQDAETDPRVIKARATLKEARTPEAVQKATEELKLSRTMCHRSARNLREMYGGLIDKLRADMAMNPTIIEVELPSVLPTAEQLLFGPRTVASRRAS